MKTVLLIGLGRFGRHIARRLYDLDHQVLAVDSNEDCVNRVLSYVTSAQIGDSTNPVFLATLGVKEFDVCIVAIGDDFQSSLETVALLKELGARKVIARAATGTQEKFLLRNGADEVVYPEKQLASWVAVRCTSDHMLDYIELDGDYSLYELAVPEQWEGKSLLEMDLRKKYGINVLGIRKNGKLDMNVRPEAEFGKNMSVLLLGNDRSVQRCFRY